MPQLCGRWAIETKMLPFGADRWGGTAAVQGDRAASEEGGRAGLVRHVARRMRECDRLFDSTAGRIRIGATISRYRASSADVRYRRARLAGAQEHGPPGLDRSACFRVDILSRSCRCLPTRRRARCASSSGCGFRIFMAPQRSGRPAGSGFSRSSRRCSAPMT